MMDDFENLPKYSCAFVFAFCVYCIDLLFSCFDE